MTDLVQRIKEECADAYFAAEYYKIQPFGCEADVSDKLFFACNPLQNNRFSGWQRFWLPEPFKVLMADESELVRKYGLHKLFLLHYSLNKRKAKKNLKNDEKDIEIIDRFPRKTSCIYIQFTSIGRRVDVNIPLIVGPTQVTSETMRYLKEDKDNTFKLLSNIIVPSASSQYPGRDPKMDVDIKFVQENTHSIHVYDLVSNPMEVHFNLK